MNVLKSERSYTDAELADARRAGIYDFKLPGRGLLYYSTGDWWPQELERRSLEHARLAAAESAIANALRREQANWPRGTDDSIPGPLYPPEEL